ncbi:hypothetical protein ACKEIK_001574 [Klebsiella pneumoniae]
MTSKLTRERLQEIAEDGFLKHGESKELARMALVAMDSEPVAYISKSDFDAGYPHILARRDFNKACTMPVYAAQPVPVVPKSISVRQAISALESADAVTTIGQAYKMGWNHCRAAMLQASPVCTCPSGDGSLRWPCPVHPGNSPAQSDCCPAQNSVAPEQNGVSPAQGGNSPATSDNWQVEAEKLAEMHGMSFVLFRHGEAPQCADPTKVVISFTDKGLGHDALPAAPQEVKSES